MATLPVNCIYCGGLELPACEIVLRPDRPGTKEGYYSFTCPICDTEQRKPLIDHTFYSILIAEGAQIFVEKTSSESEVEEFCSLMADDELFAQELQKL